LNFKRFTKPNLWSIPGLKKTDLKPKPVAFETKTETKPEIFETETRKNAYQDSITACQVLNRVSDHEMVEKSLIG